MTFVAVFEIFGDLVFAVLSAIFSIVPDMVEGKEFLSPNGSAGYIRWKKNHRTFSHWWVIYVVVLVSGFLIITVSKVAGYITIAMAAGSLFHILEDSVSGKVPALFPRKKSFGVRLIGTGSVGEKMLVFSAVVIFVAVSFLKGG